MFPRAYVDGPFLCTYAGSPSLRAYVESPVGAWQLSPPDYRGAAAALLYKYLSLGTAKVFPRRIFYPYGWWEQGVCSSEGEAGGRVVETGG